MEGPTTLQAARLELRPYRFDDLDALLEYSTDERWARFLPVPQPYTRADGEQWIAQSILVDWNDNPRFALIVGGRCSGGVDLRVNRAQNTGELGYSLAPALWGRGLMVEAVATVMEWGFDRSGLAKVSAETDAENRQSWRVMEKLGMRREGVFRSERLRRGERRDVVWYGVLRDEWESARATR